MGELCPVKSALPRFYKPTCTFNTEQVQNGEWLRPKDYPEEYGESIYSPVNAIAFEVLGYARWENFVVAVGRAIESCKSLKVNVDDHFRELTKMVNLGSGSHRLIQNFMLTRYACYLIALC